MKLPKELEREYRRILARIKREERTPYLASFEREAIRQGLREGYEEGKQDGLQQGLLQVLAGRFGTVSPTTQAKIQRINDFEALQHLYIEAIQKPDLETFEQALDRYLSSDAATE